MANAATFSRKGRFNRSDLANHRVKTQREETWKRNSQKKNKTRTHKKNIRRALPLRLLVFPLLARQPSARHNKPIRTASRRAGDSSGSHREGGRWRRRKKRAGKPREAGATTATLPHSSPRLPSRRVESPWTPAPRPPSPPRVAAARRAGPICSAAPPASSGALLPAFALCPSPPRLLTRGHASLSVGTGMARAPDLLWGRGGVGGC